MRRPTLYIAVAFAAGITAVHWTRMQHLVPVALGAFASALAGVLARRQYPSLIAILLAAFLAGAFACEFRERSLGCSDLRIVVGSRPVHLAMRGIILKPAFWETRREERSGPRYSATTCMRVDAIHAGRGWAPVGGCVNVTLLSRRMIALDCGDCVEMLGTLRPIKGPTSPGQFDRGRFWRRRGIAYAFQVRGEGRVIVLRPRAAARVVRWIESLRLRLRRGLETGVPDCPERRLILAMILGYRERIGDEISTPFRLTNTMHILAISGLHVGFFFLVVNTLFKLLRIPERVASLIALPLIALYAALTGAAVPVIRASVMFMSFLAAPFLNRQRDALNSLGTAALIILAINPLQLSDIGFQLSFGAVLAILLFSSPIAGCLHRVWPCCALQGQLDVSQWEKLRWRAGRTAIAFCATSTAAWIGLAPLIAHVFHLISLLSLLGNMVVIPAGFAVVCLGFAGAIGSLFSTGLAWCANRLNCFVVWLMLAGVRCVARIPWSWRGVAESGASSVLLHYTVIACAASALIGRWRAGGRLTLLCLAGGLLLLPVAFARDESRLQIVFLDVGQGDATYVEFPGGANMLIDGGPATAPPAGASVVWPFLQSRGRCDVDAVVLTHPHDDHVSGLFKVLSECSVDRLVVADWGDPPAPYRKLLELAREKGVRICRVRRGDVFAWGDGLRVTVLNPGRTLHRGTASDFNNNSIALRIEYGQVRILIAADMEAEAEADLCRSGLRLAADALRVGHHGGAASSTAEFVRRVSPRWAVVSAGENNRFDHPSPKALARLRGAGCRLFRTDLHGSVMLSTDGTTADVTPFP